MMKRFSLEYFQRLLQFMKPGYAFDLIYSRFRKFNEANLNDSANGPQYLANCQIGWNSGKRQKVTYQSTNIDFFESKFATTRP